VTAQAVAHTLGESGLAVELRAINEVASVEPYCAVVLGVALYVGRLHKDARRFLNARREALTTIRVALFVPGPIERREKDWSGARQQLEKELARLPWLTPAAGQVVGGAFDSRKLGFPWKIIPALRKIPVSDARDWAAIRVWANDLAGALQAGQPTPTNARGQDAPSSTEG